MSRAVVVLVSCPTTQVAKRVANELVRRRLVACVNVISVVDSVFRWKAKVSRCREALLVMKTTRRRFTSLKRAVILLHPYEVPEVIALPVAAGHRPYLQWVSSSVS